MEGGGGNITTRVRRLSSKDFLLSNVRDGSDLPRAPAMPPTSRLKEENQGLRHIFPSGFGVTRVIQPAFTSATVHREITRVSSLAVCRRRT